jgi:hypothetical protein
MAELCARARSAVGMSTDYWLSFLIILDIIRS